MMCGADNGWQGWSQGLWEEVAGEVQEKYEEEMD